MGAKFHGAAELYKGKKRQGECSVSEHNKDCAVLLMGQIALEPEVALLFISVGITLEWKQSLSRWSRTVASLQLRYILCSAPVAVIWPFELTSSEMKDIFLSGRQTNCCFNSQPEAQTCCFE